MKKASLNFQSDRTWKVRIYLTIVAACLSFGAMAQAEEASRRRNFNTNNGIALREFDAVSYFTASRPLKGNSKFYHHYKGISYYFANAERSEERRVGKEHTSRWT